MHVGGFGADGGGALVEAHHHRDAPLRGTVGKRAVQGAAVHHAAVAGRQHHRHGFRQPLADGRKAAVVGQPPAAMAAGHHPQAVLRRAVRPGDGEVEAVRLAAAVRLFQGSAIVRPVGTAVLMPGRGCAFPGGLVEHALVERHEVLAVDAGRHAQDLRMRVGAQRRIHHQQRMRNQAHAEGLAIGLALPLVQGVVAGEPRRPAMPIHIRPFGNRGTIQHGVELSREFRDFGTRQHASEDVEAGAAVRRQDVSRQAPAAVEAHRPAVAKRERPLDAIVAVLGPRLVGGGVYSRVGHGAGSVDELAPPYANDWNCAMRWQRHVRQARSLPAIAPHSPQRRAHTGAAQRALRP